MQGESDGGLTQVTPMFAFYVRLLQVRSDPYKTQGCCAWTCMCDHMYLHDKHCPSLAPCPVGVDSDADGVSAD